MVDMKRPPIPGEKSHGELYWWCVDAWDAVREVVLTPGVLLLLACIIGCVVVMVLCG